MEHQGGDGQLHSFQLAEGIGKGIRVVKKVAGEQVIVNTWRSRSGNNIIATEMGAEGLWENKILASFSEPATLYIAGEGNWVAIASIPWEDDSSSEIIVALWHLEERLPGVILPIANVKDGHQKFLTGIIIESAKEGPKLKLVITLDEVDELGNDGAQQDCRGKRQLGPG